MATSDIKTYQNYVGGEWIDSESGNTYPISNPASKRTVIAKFQTSVAEEMTANCSDLLIAVVVYPPDKKIRLARNQDRDYPDSQK